MAVGLLHVLRKCAPSPSVQLGGGTLDQGTSPVPMCLSCWGPEFGTHEQVAGEDGVGKPLPGLEAVSAQQDPAGPAPSTFTTLLTMGCSSALNHPAVAN